MASPSYSHLPYLRLMFLVAKNPARDKIDRIRSLLRDRPDPITANQSIQPDPYLEQSTSNFPLAERYRFMPNYTPRFILDEGKPVSKNSSSKADLELKPPMDWLKDYDPAKMDKVNNLCSIDADIQVLEFYHKLIDPPMAYLKHLHHFRDDDNRRDATGKITSFTVFDHGEDRANIIFPNVECADHNPCSKFQSIRASASRTAKKLTNLRWTPNSPDEDKVMIRLDLTFPKEISKLLEGDPSNLPPKLWTTYKEFFDKLESVLGVSGLGHNANLHLWSTKQPTQPHAHFHSNILWAKSVGDHLQTLEWFDDHKRKPVDADFVRTLWKESIESNFDITISGDVDLYVRWIPLTDRVKIVDGDKKKIKAKPKIIHRLKYSRRKPLTDLAEFYLDNEFDPGEFDDGFNEFLLDYTNRSRVFGLWTNLKQHVSSSVNLKDDKKICPLCGRSIDKVYEWDVGTFQPDKLGYVDREGRFYLGDPPPPPADGG